MAERSRLLSGYGVLSSVQGSNPCVSAPHFRFNGTLLRPPVKAFGLAAGASASSSFVTGLEGRTL